MKKMKDTGTKNRENNLAKPRRLINRNENAYQTGDKGQVIKIKYDSAPFGLITGDDEWYRASTKGSAGTIVSIAEYCDFILDINKNEHPSYKYISKNLNC